MWYAGAGEALFEATGRAMAKGRSLSQFQETFPDEASCAAFLSERRLPEGFVCPGCGEQRAAGAEEPGVHVRMPRLRPTVFGHVGNGDASFQAADDDVVLGGASHGDTFERHVGAAIGRSTRRHLHQAEIPFREGDAFFEPGNAGKILVAGAVEVIDRDTNQPKPRRKHAKIPRYALWANTPRYDRRQFRVVDRGLRESQREAWSHALTDGHGVLSWIGRPTGTIRASSEKWRDISSCPGSHRAFSLMKRWGLGTYHGLRRTHVDTYLNEFVFRYNRRFHRHVSFEALLGLAAHHAPASYWDIVNRDNPRKGVQTIRRTPRRRKTATGMRRDGAALALGAAQNQPINQCIHYI
jgi:hypothetical protein